LGITIGFLIGYFCSVKQLLLLILAFASLISCKKRNLGIEEEGSLNFSQSTVLFDTVFTGIGSATQTIKVYNPHDKEISIASVSLEGTAGKSYRFNLDGFPGNQKDISIPAKDSLFLFTEVTIDANNTFNPFFVEDNIIFITNGVEQKVKLTAYGQNAYYYRPNRAIEGLPAFSNISSYLPDQLTSLEVNWKNDKPHVIYGYLLVDSLLTLNIEAGTQIHFHAGAGLWVYRGASLNVNGELDNEVVFQGDRLEAEFDDVAGQWDRIWINTGAASTIKHTHIKNGFVGLQVEPLPFDEMQDVVPEKVTVQKTTISNMAGIGVFLRNANFDMENSQVYNMGNYNIAITGGGTMNFLNNTLANYWSTNREDPMLFISNRYISRESSEEAVNLNLRFGNTIIYGSKEEELELDSSTAADYNVLFDHCVIRTELVTSNRSRYKSCIINPSNVTVGDNSFLPVYKNQNDNDFSLFEQSVAVDKGSIEIVNLLQEKTDIKENTRDSKPDIGAFEFK
jgi:hypothetical protein